MLHSNWLTITCSIHNWWYDAVTHSSWYATSFSSAHVWWTRPVKNTLDAHHWDMLPHPLYSEYLCKTPFLNNSSVLIRKWIFGLKSGFHQNKQISSIMEFICSMTDVRMSSCGRLWINLSIIFIIEKKKTIYFKWE